MEVKDKCYKHNIKFAIFFSISFFVLYCLIFHIYPQYFEKPEISYKEGKFVVFKEDVVEKLNEEYKKDFEYFYCLQGEINGNTIYVDDLYKPEIIRTETGVHVLEGCYDVPNCIGTIHSHPEIAVKKYGTPRKYLCSPSYQDVFSYGYSYGVDNNLKINIIQCGENLFNIMEITKTGIDYEHSLKWGIK